MATRTLNVVISGDAKGVTKATRQVEGSIDRMSRSGSKSLAMLRTGFIAVGAAAATGAVIGIKKSAEAAIEAEKANARLETQLRALNIRYAEHEKRIQRTLDAHSQLSGFDDEDLGDSFTNIVRVVGNVNQALELNGLAMDFARAKHMDVAKAGELVGKVAGGNTGILARYGITIKEGATATEALAVLQQKFAGQAEAYGRTTAGAQDRARVAFENLGETIGARVTPVIARVAEGFNTLVRQMTLGQGPGGRIRAVLERVGEAAIETGRQIADLVGWFRRHRTATTALLSVAAGLTAAFVAYKVATIAAAVATKTLAAATVLLNVAMRANPIGLVVTALIALGTGLVVAYKRSETFRRIVNAGFDHVKRNARAAVTVFNSVLLPAFKAIVSAAEKVWGALKKVGGILGGVGGAAKDAAGFLNPFGDGLGKTASQMDITGLGGKTGLMGADPDLGPFAAIGARMGLSVSSGIRPGAITSTGGKSYHSTGDAIDMSGPPGAMMRFATSMRQNFGGRLRELIYTPMGSGIKDGRPYQYSGQVAADHFDHVHVAYTGPFGDGIGQAVSAARAAGFRGKALENIVAIAGAESRYDAEALNPNYPDYSVGMTQINMLAHGKKYGTEAQLKNPLTNFKAAWEISSHGRNFGPWTTWPNAAQAYLARARAAISGSGSRGRVGAGGDAGSRGGAAGGPAPEPRFGPGGGGTTGIEQRLAGVEVRKARAERQDNVMGLINALQDERSIKRRKLKRIRKLLRGRLTKARRLTLTQEEATLIGEIGDLSDTIKEYSADVSKGGATTITRAEELEAGVDTSVDTGAGGTADTGGGGVSDDSAAINELTAAITRMTNLNEWMVRTQGPTLVGAVLAAVNGGIGGEVGLGFQGIRSAPGSVAGL